MASANYYNFLANESLKEKAVTTLRTYGVGPCGPPNFYGTQDVHMQTEADVAAHLGVPAVIIYAQAFSTASSVIPAFAKRGDIIVADSAVNYSVRKGLQLSRSTVYWYRHNDMEDLEQVLQRVVKIYAKKPLTRRFIVAEGLYENVGDMVDLARLVTWQIRHNNSCVCVFVCVMNLTVFGVLLLLPGPTQTPVQVPHHPRRNPLVRCPGRNRPWTQRILTR
jgi:serine palmitoyltransferase